MTWKVSVKAIDEASGCVVMPSLPREICYVVYRGES